MFSLNDCSRYWIENLISSHITAPSFEILVVSVFKHIGDHLVTTVDLATVGLPKQSYSSYLIIIHDRYLS